MGDIFVEQLIQTPVEEQAIELVERKGLGHPDSLCDSIANHASVALCQEYKKVFGRILHHNLDKALLVAGSSSPRVGGGTIEKPMRLILGDRATAAFQGKSIDVQGVVIEAAKDWMRRNLRFVDPERHVIFQNEIRAGSPELTDIFERGRMGANDTSAAVGFAPFTLTEQVVFSVEKYMNSPPFKQQFPDTGEDIKVMGLRHKRELHLTIAVAFVDRFVPDSRTYFARKEEMTKSLSRYLGPLQRDYDRIKVDINALDDRLRADDGMYLTVLGTSAEGADSGQVGRGNRVNGVISLNRPQSTEAHAGKNPVSHVGKIYSYFSSHVAQQIASKVNGIREVYVQLCSQIGRPIDEPLTTSLKLILEPGASLGDVSADAESVAAEELARISEFASMLATDDFYRTWEQGMRCDCCA
jgi:S-adenosylmethionine synthetase